jgi:hypothetical protein
MSTTLRDRGRIFLGVVSNFSGAVRRCTEGQPIDARDKPNEKGKPMPKFLVAVQLPTDYDPSTESEATVRDIDALNDEMEAAGARFFAGGLSAPSSAKSLRQRTGGDVFVTDGPYSEAKEHIGGFWILNAANMDEALAWGRKAVVACRAPIEVRQFMGRRD